MNRFLDRLIDLQRVSKQIDIQRNLTKIDTQISIEIDRYIDRLMNELDIVNRQIFEKFDISKFRVKLLDEVQERYSTQCLGDDCCRAQVRKHIQHNIEEMSVAEPSLGHNVLEMSVAEPSLGKILSTMFQR